MLYNKASLLATLSFSSAVCASQNAYPIWKRQDLGFTNSSISSTTTSISQTGGASVAASDNSLTSSTSSLSVPAISSSLTGSASVAARDNSLTSSSSSSALSTPTTSSSLTGSASVAASDNSLTSSSSSSSLPTPTTSSSLTGGANVAAGQNSLPTSSAAPTSTVTEIVTVTLQDYDFTVQIFATIVVTIFPSSIGTFSQTLPVTLTPTSAGLVYPPVTTTVTQVVTVSDSPDGPVVTGSGNIVTQQSVVTVILAPTNGVPATYTLGDTSVVTVAPSPAPASTYTVILPPIVVTVSVVEVVTVPGVFMVNPGNGQLEPSQSTVYATVTQFVTQFVTQSGSGGGSGGAGVAGQSTADVTTLTSTVFVTSMYANSTVSSTALMNSTMLMNGTNFR